MADVLRRNTLQYARMCPSTTPHYTDKPHKKMASIIKLPSGAYRVQIRQNRSLKYEINSSRQNRGGSIRQRPGVHCSEGACLDRSCPRKDRIHRTRLIMGKRILRKLQCPVPRRVAQWRNLLQPTGGQSPDRNNGAFTTTSSGRTALWGIVHPRRKASYQWTRGPRCTNNLTGPLNGGRSFDYHPNHPWHTKI